MLRHRLNYCFEPALSRDGGSICCTDVFRARSHILRVPLHGDLVSSVAVEKPRAASVPGHAKVIRSLLDSHVVL